MTKEKFIVCSAILFDDSKVYEHQPKNVKTGYVICGHRHHNCFMTKMILEDLPGKNIPNIQGFITNDYYFVDRKEAAKIAFESGQTKHSRMFLYSEDLY